MCHTRELAFQISKEYERFSKYMPNVKVRGVGQGGCEESEALGTRGPTVGYPRAVGALCCQWCVPTGWGTGETSVSARPLL